MAREGFEEFWEKIRNMKVTKNFYEFCRLIQVEVTNFWSKVLVLF
jgi:hypothetical protein